MKKLNIKSLLLLFATAFILTACSEDELNPQSVLNFKTLSNNDFDKWLDVNYVQPYNIRYNYQYNDKESDLSYNVVPSDFNKSVALAILVKHVWLESYVEALGETFMRTYTPRIIQLTGSYKYSANGEQVLGTAEGGLKVMLYGVNAIDIDNPRVNVTDPYADRNITPIDMGYWFFHTMHHEFCHILTQTKEYSPEFKTISGGHYHSADWINIKDKTAAKEGFTTGYASSEYNEDFAETYAWYVTMSEEGWNKILEQAGEEGSATLMAKVAMVRTYFQESWGLDIDKMRDIIVRRSREAEKLDLRTLN